MCKPNPRLRLERKEKKIKYFYAQMAGPLKVRPVPLILRGPPVIIMGPPNVWFPDCQKWFLAEIITERSLVGGLVLGKSISLGNLIKYYLNGVSKRSMHVGN